MKGAIISHEERERLKTAVIISRHIITHEKENA